MDSWCRLCSRSDEFRRFPLFVVAEVSQEVIANMITSCTDTQVSGDDGLPQQICPDCLITLSLAHSFRKLCRRTDAKLRTEAGEIRAPTDTAQHLHNMRRSQSQVTDENASFNATPVIKEEIEYYEYDCDAMPPQVEEQWVIQNPRTIHDGSAGMSSSSMAYEGGPDQHGDPSAAMLMPLVTMGDGHMDPAEYGESSGLGGAKGERWKKKPPTPERFSKRIRRQETPKSHDVPPFSEGGGQQQQRSAPLPELPGEIILTGGRQLVINPAQRHCEYCKKKMKKPYKHRNGKCMVPKAKAPSKPRCPYCHMVFIRKKSIPTHLRNTCRVYRELCLTEQLPEPEPDTEPSLLTPLAGGPIEHLHNVELQVVHLDNTQVKTIDVKPLVKPKSRRYNAVCQYCYQTFTKRVNLAKHQKGCCSVLKELKLQKLEHVEEFDETSAMDDSPSGAGAQQLLPASVGEGGTKCVYCTQKVSKKTRYQHHNGRCVLGRVNADHPCPYCPAAFSSRSNLLRHQRERCQQYQEEQTAEVSSPSKDASVAQQYDDAQLEEPPTAWKPQKKVKKMICKHCNQRISEKDRAKHKEKRCLGVENCTAVKDTAAALTFCCGYCRKGFASRESLIEHQRVCTARKLHKQVKCQFCGMNISNRGNLRKHQKLWCKKAPREDAELKLELVDVNQDLEPVQVVSPPPAPVVKSTKKVIKKEKKSIVVVSSKTADTSGIVNKEKYRSRLPCPYCARSFQTKLQVRNHTLKCADRVKFQCQYCAAEFTCQSNRRRHERKQSCFTALQKQTAEATLENCFQPDNSELINSTTFQQKVEANDADLLLGLENLPAMKDEPRPAKSLGDNNNALNEKELEEQPPPAAPESVPMETAEPEQGN